MATFDRAPLDTPLRRRRPSVDSLSWSSELSPLLNGKDTFFGAPGQTKTYDWPNPRGPVFPIANRTWTESLTLTLLGKDQFFGAAGQPPANHDWPVPRGPARSVDTRTWLSNLLENTLGIPPTPFAQYDWPNPGRRRREPGLVGDMPIQLIGQDQFFGAAGQVPEYDWPNPLRRGASVDTRTWLANLLESTLAPSIQPFFTTDWPNPQARAYPVALRIFSQSLKPGLADTFFGGAGQPHTAWVFLMPRGPGRPDQSLIPPNLLGTTLAPPVIVVSAGGPYIPTFRPRRR